MNIRRIPESRVNEKINEWTIISFCRSDRKFIGKCKCGFERKMQIADMKRQKTCQKCKFKQKNESYVGKTFNKLTVIESVFDNGKNKLKVKCQCGNEYLMNPYQLKYTQGCCKCRKGFFPGKIIDGLEIIKYIGKSKYEIKCICGNIFECIPKKYNGHYQTCGCKRRNHLLEEAEKHVGIKYENFIVKKVCGILDGHVIFELKCKCGNVILRKNGHLFKSKSCGCLNNKFLRKGENAPSAKLKNTEIIAMRELYDSGQYNTQKLMEMYDLPYSYVRRIITRKIWKNI